MTDSKTQRCVARLDLVGPIPAPGLSPGEGIDMGLFGAAEGDMSGPKAGWENTQIQPIIEDPAYHVGAVGAEDSGFERISWHGKEYVVANIDLDYSNSPELKDCFPE